MEKYTDKTSMPFGKYKGIPLSDVPASYLHWWYTQTNRSNIPLKLYIEESLDALKEEYPDGIWK